MIHERWRAPEGFFVVNPFDVINSPGDPNGAKADIASNLAFNVGTLGPNASTTLTYYVVFATSRQSAENLYQVQLGTAVPVSPTSVSFVNGVWTGNVTVTQAAVGMHLHVNDGSGHGGDSNTFDTSSAAPLLLSVPANATEGDGTVMGTVSVPIAPATDLTVSLTSSDPSRATVPTTVVIPAGQTSVGLPITIIDDTLLNGPEAIVIGATTTNPNYAPGSGTITIHDNETTTLAVTLPATAHETGGTLVGTVTSGQAPTRDITVQLASNDTSQLTVPATVILPAGQTSVNFTATLLDDHIIESGPTPVTVTAQMDNWTPGSGTVNIIDDDHTMTVTLPASGWEGQAFPGAGTIQIGGTLTLDLVVSLTPSDPTEMSLPATVTIPAGQMSATFDVRLLDNGLCQGPQTVDVTATAADLPTAETSMVVKDADVYQFGFDTIGSAATAGVPFSVTARAYDILGNPILVYNGTASLTASGDSGPLPIMPTSVTFVAGVWTGDVTVNTADTNVALRVDNGAGVAGTSNTTTVWPMLQVVSTTPSVGGTFTLPGPFTYDVTFNDPVTPSSVTTSSLVLSGISGATVTGATVLPGDMTVRFTIDGATTEGTLAASIASGAITDPAGNAGIAFSARYLVDIGTVAFPVPLVAVNPLGSLVYTGSTTGVINPAGDTDSFTIVLDAGQTLTADVAPTAALQPTLTITGPDGATLGSATAAAVGKEVFLQTVPVTTAGTYTMTVGGAAGTGAYTLQIDLNAAVEAESHDGPTNDSFASAQSLDPAFASLGNTAAQARPCWAPRTPMARPSSRGTWTPIPAGHTRANGLGDSPPAPVAPATAIPIPRPAIRATMSSA